MEYRNKIHAWNVKVIAEVDSMHFKWFGEAKSHGGGGAEREIRWGGCRVVWATLTKGKRWR